MSGLGLDTGGVMSPIVILDVFKQEADYSIPSHYCVQFRKQGDTFVNYNYFATLKEANDFASVYGWEG